MEIIYAHKLNLGLIGRFGPSLLTRALINDIVSLSHVKVKFCKTESWLISHTVPYLINIFNPIKILPPVSLFIYLFILIRRFIFIFPLGKSFSFTPLFE